MVFYCCEALGSESVLTGQMTPHSALPKSRPGKLGTQMKKNH
eukprot:COSAG05_NODE_5586_length_1135_cov_1.300193_2_plen_41_part_01